MALKHKEYNVFGLQFHPESIYTPNGKHMIGNFVINICNDVLEE
jgi:anthranilate synthase component 2